MATAEKDPEMQAMEIDVTMRILRFDPEKDTEPYFESYTVQCEPTERLLDALHKVK